MKGSHFPSTRTTNLVRLILGSQKGNNFTRTALRKVHHTSPFALRAETSSRSNMIPMRTKLTHRRQLSLTREGESDFLPLSVIFSRVSSAIDGKTRVLEIRASCFYISHENLGQASYTVCYQSNFISGTSFFSQWYFPSSGRSTNENLWETVASSPFLGTSRLRRSLAHSRAACFVRPNRRACSQAITPTSAFLYVKLVVNRWPRSKNTSTKREKAIREIKIHVNAKREFVPREQVFPLIVVYCLLLPLRNK